MTTQTQRILTLWGLLTYDQETTSYFENDIPQSLVKSGYKPLNELISQLTGHVTIRSVSYSHLVFPMIDNMYTLQIFATLIYTGPSPREIFGAQNKWLLEEVAEDTTTLQVEL